MATGNVISFDDHANDLHRSEWAQLLRSVAEDLEKLALAHEDHLNEGHRPQAFEYLGHLESLIGAARHRLNRGGKR